MLYSNKNNNSSFTLIELLVVLALVAILSVVVIITLNPAELIKQARDSNRLSDLSTINTALNLFSTDVTSGFMGTSTIVYVSLPDTSPTCANLGLPALPTSTIVYTYNCVTSQNLRNTDGSGWIPVNFQQISSNSPISQLPIDPINTTSTGNYYTYVSGGSWILTAIPESQKQKTELSLHPQITNYPGVIGAGNNVSLSPLYNSTGLVGYWNFDEGSGTTAADSSGQGNLAVLVSSPSWVSGKIMGALAFNGTSYASTTSGPLLSTPWTIAFWVKFSNYNLPYPTVVSAAGSPSLILGSTVSASFYSGSLYFTASPIPTDQWTHRVYVSYGGNIAIYNNGVFIESKTYSPPTFSSFRIGKSADGYSNTGVNGQVDDVRIYNRAISAAEVAALYNATK